MRKKPVFENLMTGREAAALLAWLPVHVFLLPALITGYTLASGNTLTPVFSRAVYFGLGLLVVVIFARGFLRRSFDVLLDNFGHCLTSIAMSFAAMLLLSQLVAMVILAVDENVFNSIELASQAAGEGGAGFLILGAGAIPVVEETLFRGLIFGSLRKRSRLLAYLISALVFMIYSVWQLLFTSAGLGQVAIIALSYLPELITLTWCYERTGCIWSPILLTALVNFVVIAPSLG